MLMSFCLYNVGSPDRIPATKSYLGCRLPALLVGCLLAVHARAPLDAATIQAASPSLFDVSNAVRQASSGDTVLIPPGIGYWNNFLSISNKSITLMGSGTSETIIVDEIPSNRELLVYLTQNITNGMARISQIQFRGGKTNTSALKLGIIFVRGSNMQSNNSAWRIDHCLFAQPNSRPIHVRAWSGLIDHCEFINNNGGIMFDNRIEAGEFGDLSWATPVRYGTVDSGVYVESCFFTNAILRGASDSAAGSRWVYRYNTLYNMGIQSHGTESTMRARGLRSMEVYGNVFTNNVVFSEYAMHMRSGSAVVFSNTVYGKWPGILRLATYRLWDVYTPWGQANGTNAFDHNDPTVYAVGTHTGTNGSTVLVDAKVNWTPNKWAGYNLQNTTRAKTGPEGAAAVISANTANTITYANSSFAPDRLFWTNGEAYRIVRVIQALDAPGAGYGILLSGGGDHSAPSPARWPFQTNREPVYIWANSGLTAIGISSPDILAGRNYTNAPLPGYSPLPYPHPYAAVGKDGSTVVQPPGNLRLITQ